MAYVLGPYETFKMECVSKVCQWHLVVNYFCEKVPVQT